MLFKYVGGELAAKTPHAIRKTAAKLKSPCKVANPVRQVPAKPDRASR